MIDGVFAWCLLRNVAGRLVVSSAKAPIAEDNILKVGTNVSVAIIPAHGTRGPDLIEESYCVPYAFLFAWVAMTQREYQGAKHRHELVQNGHSGAMKNLIHRWEPEEVAEVVLVGPEHPDRVFVAASAIGLAESGNGPCG